MLEPTPWLASADAVRVRGLLVIPQIFVMMRHPGLLRLLLFSVI
jgi:hypothetical protein